MAAVRSIAVYSIRHAIGLDKDITYRFSKWDKNNKEKYIAPEVRIIQSNCDIITYSEMFAWRGPVLRGSNNK